MTTPRFLFVVEAHDEDFRVHHSWSQLSRVSPDASTGP